MRLDFLRGLDQKYKEGMRYFVKIGGSEGKGGVREAAQFANRDEDLRRNILTFLYNNILQGV